MKRETNEGIQGKSKKKEAVNMLQSCHAKVKKKCFQLCKLELEKLPGNVWTQNKKK